MRLFGAGRAFRSVFAVAVLIGLTATPGWSIPQPSDTLSLLKKAYADLGKGNLDHAIGTLCQAIRSDRNSAMARRYLSFALLQRGDAHEAITQLDALATLNRGIPFDLCMRGQALQMLGENAKATEALKAAVGMDAKNDYIRDKLIDVLSASGKYQEASAVCADGYYAARGKLKDHYLAEFNQIQQARALLLQKNGGYEITTTTAQTAQDQAAAAPDANAAGGQMATAYGSNASSFAKQREQTPAPK